MAIIIVTAIFTALTVYYIKPNKLELPFPNTNKLLNKSNFACESLVGTSISGQNSELYKKGIIAEIFKGTDQIAIEIDNEKLYFCNKSGTRSGCSKR